MRRRGKMDQETSLLITQLLAVWGAVLSTLVAVWHFRNSLRQGGRLRLTIWVGRASSTGSIRPFFEFQVVNVGRLAAYFGGVVLHDGDGNYIDQALGPRDDGEFWKLEPGQACQCGPLPHYEHADRILRAKSIFALDSHGRRVQLSKWRLWRIRREVRSIRLESEALRGRDTQPN